MISPLKNPRATEECLEEMNASLGLGYLLSDDWIDFSSKNNHRSMVEFPASYIGVLEGILSPLKGTK